MNDGGSRLIRMTAIGAATLLAALSFPQLAMAAPASGSAASSATAVTSALTPPHRHHGQFRSLADLRIHRL
jgi:hypothetical protein